MSMVNQDTIKLRKSDHRPRADLQTIAAYLVLILLIGGNFVAVRFSSFGLPPFWGGASALGRLPVTFYLCGYPPAHSTKGARA